MDKLNTKEKKSANLTVICQLLSEYDARRYLLCFVFISLFTVEVIKFLNFVRLQDRLGIQNHLL